jgi:hypothetical protein
MIKSAFNKIIAASVFFALVSCAKDKKSETTNKSVTVQDSLSKSGAEEESAIDESTAKRFPIGKGRLGPITIGMTMAKANSLLTDFEKQKAESYDFGYDGGGDAWIYNKNGRHVFAIVPSYTDSIIAIVAIDKDLKSSKGLHPGMTVKELISFYPNAKTYLNLMMSWEEIIDDVNGWENVFITSEEKRIGEYKDVDSPGLPKRFDVKSDWITITAPVIENDCSLLRGGGTFTYKDPQGEDVIVKINDDTWTEEHKNGQYVTLATMKWTGKCEYENTLIMSSLPGFSLSPGTVMAVTIDKVEGFDVYFTATAAGKSYHSKLTKI